MKKMALVSILILLPLGSALANCDFSQFHGDCDIPLHIRPSAAANSIVSCGGTYAYVTKSQFDQLSRYNRVNVNMVLKINGEYVDSPCIPINR